MKSMLLVATAASGVLGTASESVGQSAIELVSAADTTLYQTEDGFTSNGAGNSMFAGLTLRGAGLRRGLIRFDLSVVPDGYVIVDARLRLQVTRANGAAASVSLHRVLSSWGESSSDAGEPGGGGTEAAAGDATWLHRFHPNVFWSTAGGDFEPQASAVATVGDPGPAEWTASPRMLADLNAWLVSPGVNFGWLLQSVSVDSSSARRFSTREHENRAERPVLEVTAVRFCEACLGDVNCDGVVDGDDVIGFFIPWDGGLPGGDFNGDGNTDGDDVIEFFARWDAGC